MQPLEIHLVSVLSSQFVKLQILWLWSIHWPNYCNSGFLVYFISSHILVSIGYLNNLNLFINRLLHTTIQPRWKSPAVGNSTRHAGGLDIIVCWLLAIFPGGMRMVVEIQHLWHQYQKLNGSWDVWHHKWSEAERVMSNWSCQMSQDLLSFWYKWHKCCAVLRPFRAEELYRRAHVEPTGRDMCELDFHHRPRPSGKYGMYAPASTECPRTESQVEGKIWGGYHHAIGRNWSVQSCEVRLGM